MQWKTHLHMCKHTPGGSSEHTKWLITQDTHILPRFVFIFTFDIISPIPPGVLIKPCIVPRDLKVFILVRQEATEVRILFISFIYFLTSSSLHSSCTILWPSSVRPRSLELVAWPHRSLSLWRQLGSSERTDLLGPLQGSPSSCPIALNTACYRFILKNGPMMSALALHRDFAFLFHPLSTDVVQRCYAWWTLLYIYI